MTHAVSIATLTAAERTRNEELFSKMRKAAVARLDQMEHENELNWPDLKHLSEGRDEVAADALRREVDEAAGWWRAQLREQGHAPDLIERLIRAYVDAFWTALRDRVCGFDTPGGGIDS